MRLVSSGVGGANVDVVQGALVAVEMWSTTVGRIGTSFSVAIAVRARLFTVRSNGANPRTDTVSASAPIRSRRREVTVVALSWSVKLPGRCPLLSVFRRVWRPWPSSSAFPPISLAIAVCSPLGSPSK